jgi:hypothetical protein
MAWPRLRRCLDMCGEHGVSSSLRHASGQLETARSAVPTLQSGIETSIDRLSVPLRQARELRGRICLG